jgi:hypothetical protein
MESEYSLPRPSPPLDPILSQMSTVYTHTVLFVVYLTTLFQYLRLYSVDLYSVRICLPSTSEAGETRVRNMAAEFCRRAPNVLVWFFYMP